MEVKLLSYIMDEKTPAYGGKDNLFKLSPLSNIKYGDTSNNTIFEFPGHLGTHIDFPKHFHNNGQVLIDYPHSFWIFKKI